MKFSEGQRLAEDPMNGCTVVRGQVQHVWLRPSDLGKIKSGVREIIEKSLGKYNDKLDGIPLAFCNVKIVPRSAVLLYDDVDMHFNVQYDVVVFRVVPGSLIKCCVNEVAADHLSCLIHKMINLAVPLPGVNFDLHDPKGLEVVCRVQNVEYKKGVLGISAELTIDSVQTLQEFYVEMTEDYVLGSSSPKGSDSPGSQGSERIEETGDKESDDDDGTISDSSVVSSKRTASSATEGLLKPSKNVRKSIRIKDQNKTRVKKHKLVSRVSRNPEHSETNVLDVIWVGSPRGKLEGKSKKLSRGKSRTSKKKESSLEDSEEHLLTGLAKVTEHRDTAIAMVTKQQDTAIATVTKQQDTAIAMVTKQQDTAIHEELTEWVEGQQDRSLNKSEKKKRKRDKKSGESEDELFDIEPLHQGSFVTSTAKKRRRERSSSHLEDLGLSWEDSVISLSQEFKDFPDSYTLLRKKGKKVGKRKDGTLNNDSGIKNDGLSKEPLSSPDRKASYEKHSLNTESGKRKKKLSIEPVSSSDGKTIGERKRKPKKRLKHRSGESLMTGSLFQEKESGISLRDSEQNISSISEDLDLRVENLEESSLGIESLDGQESLRNLKGKKKSKKVKKSKDLETSTPELSPPGYIEDQNSIYYGFSKSFTGIDNLKELKQKKKKTKRQSKVKIEKRSLELSLREGFHVDKGVNEVDELLSIPSVSSGFVEPVRKKKHSKKEKKISKLCNSDGKGSLSDLSQFVIPSPAELEAMAKKKNKKKRKRTTSDTSDRTNDSGINITVFGTPGVT